MNLLKLQSVRFESLSPSLFETCNCSYLGMIFLMCVVHRVASQIIVYVFEVWPK